MQGCTHLSVSKGFSIKQFTASHSLLLLVRQTRTYKVVFEVPVSPKARVTPTQNIDER